MNIEPEFVLSLAWLLTTVCVVAGMRRMSALRRARRGVYLVALGLTLAVAASFGHPAAGPNLALVLLAMALGGGLALASVRRAEAADSARLVALFNAFGGGAAAAIAALHLARPANVEIAWSATTIGAVIALCAGSVTAGGSVVIWMRLKSKRDVAARFSSRQVGYVATAAAMLLLALLLIASSSAHPVLIAVLMIVSVVFGVLMSLPIAIADLPVPIALYTAIAGLGVALDGLLIDNPAMIVAGSLVLATGSLLMRLSAHAMNRRLGDIMYSGFGLSMREPVPRIDSEQMNRIDPGEAAIALGYATRVLIVPGYGMALARAHHKLRELTQLLDERGVQAHFAIHPVAGRLPGHMDVLLAEAGVPYDRIIDAADANADMPSIDVALVVGADDIVNPAARRGDGGELDGLSIIEVDRAKRVIVLRRGDGIGHAGVPNPLMFATNTRVIVGDALASVQSLIAQVKLLD